MNDKIKLVYSWIGPTGPLRNTEIPSILELSAGTEHCNVNSHYWWSEDVWNNMFKESNDLFEVTSSYNMLDDDDRDFIYPFTLSWRIPFQQYFMGNNGITEFSHMPSHLLHLVREKNGYILINHSIEAFMDNDHIDSLHSYFKYTHDIPLHKIIYVTGCVNSKELYLEYCNKHNIPDNKEERLTIVSYPSSQNIFVENLKDIEPNYCTATIPEKLFLSWNRRYRPHRIILALILESLDLVDSSYISFSDVDVERQTRTFEKAIPYHEIQTWISDLSQQTINSFNDKLPLILDDENDINQMCEDAGNLTRPYYQNSLISLITETNFIDPEVSLTEKSYKPFKEKHPFITVGSSGALKGLQDQGFKTFNDFWDESYDSIKDPGLRMRAIRDIIIDITTWSDEKILEFKHNVKPIVEHNYNMLKNSSTKLVANTVYNNIRKNHD